MAKLLIDGETASPWILITDSTRLGLMPDSGYHQTNCVHTGGQKADTTPQVISSNLSRSIELSQEFGISKVRETVSQNGGLAGILPLSANTDDWRSDISSVRFTGEINSVAWISYRVEDRWLGNLQPDLVQILDSLERTLCAIGYLQRVGLCCDSFCILRLEEPSQPIELCRIQVETIFALYKNLVDLKLETSQVALRQTCHNLASQIIEYALGAQGVSELHHNTASSEKLFGVLGQCALASQVLSVGLFSYTNAHIGQLHPRFLVDPLRELHLLGLSIDEYSKHVVVELLDFTCMSDLVRDSVLVF
jgi:hypothetical protein